jgi:hypothetical protein
MSLWMSKFCTVRRFGVTVPERGVEAAELGSGLDSPKYSGGVGG